MTIDYAETAQGLANLLFAGPNATATLSSNDLISLAQDVDSKLATLSVSSTLADDQIQKVIAHVAMKRAGMI